ncbi:hypothetical protein [Winogradskyella helgolandensis]|uniref:hypothetical protein n=1 Tax=Winogradskyella helgolandensis TaxID=2697010 RepID=UPI0015CE8AFF|nr:hypothetical protein [Winogradskyella helgolandensis]
MKKIILLLLICCAFQAIAQQKLEIEIDNPEPRVGQKVTLSINMDFLNEYLKKELGKNINVTGSPSIFGMSSEDFQRIIIFDKAKTYNIGPFDFEFNGKKYTTDTMEVNVLPKLPIENGLWLRQTEFEGQHYLILEQLISNTSNKTENENGSYSHTIGGVMPEGKEFAELNEDLTQGIQLSNYSSATNSVTPDDGELFGVGFSYSIKKYKITFDEDYKGEYLISESDFNNLPTKFDIGNIKLNK